MWKSIYLLLVLSFVIYCQSQTVSPQNTKVIFQFSQFGTIAGNPIIAQIQPYDANNNPINGCVLGLNPFVATSPLASLQILYPTICQSTVPFPYVITLVSNIAKNYSVTFSYQGQNLGDSPYTIGYTFGPISANNSVASGAGLTTATVGNTATFTFKTYDQHNNFIYNCLNESDWTDFTIVLTQPVPIYGQVVGCDNTTFVYTASYQTTSTDSGFLYVQYFSNNFAQMPQTPNIISGPPYGPTCLIPSNTLHNQTQAGVAATFVLECVDQYGNTMSNCSYFDMNNWVAFYTSNQTNNTFHASSVTCSATRQGVYTFTYSNNVAALYNTNVYYKNPSNNAPNFPTLILPGPPSDVIATGPGVTYKDPSNIAGVPSYIYINMADAYGNIITECLNSSENDWDISVTPQMLIPPQEPVCFTGTMISNWTATDSSVKYSIAISYNGTSAEGSPYPTNVYSNILDPVQSTLNQLSSSSVQAGISLPFTVDGYDQYGNPIVNCSRVSNVFSVQATNLGNTSIQIIGSVNCVQLSGKVLLNGTIYGTLIGTYNLTVTYNNTQIKNSPQSFTVIPGPMDPALTFATGAGFTNQTSVVAGSSNTFYLNQRDQYNNVISSCLGNSYQWNVVILNQPNTVYLNESLVGSCSSQGVYSIPFTITVTGSYQIIVYSIKNLNYATEKPINNNGSVTVTPGPFYANYSITNVAPSAEVGDFVLVTVIPKDQYENPIGACTDTVAADLEIFARYQTSINLKIYSTGSMTCGNAIYSGYYYANTTGYYQVDVGYDIGGTYYPVGDTGITHVIYGLFNSSQSTVSGPGVGTNDAEIVAGTYALVNITTRNKNGYLIPAANSSVDPSHINFNIVGINNTAITIDNAALTGYVGNSILAQYNGTNAQYYQVKITYNESLIGNQTYTSQVVAAAIDFNTLVASNISSDESGNGNGYFDLSATDAFGNPVVVSQGLDVTLAPSCSSPNVSCIPAGLQSFCSFTVQEAGVYCISIENSTSLTQYEVANSTILVSSGGNGCSDSDYCNSNGLCYQDPSGSSFLCNCKNGYTGTNCDTKIKSHYMNLWLGIGLLIGLSILLLIIGVVLGCLLGRRNRGGKNLLN